mgnify:CR=1 FL=1
MIDTPDYKNLLSSEGTWTKAQFNSWHKRNTLKTDMASNHLLGIGWSTKLINVYLKTMVYAGQIGPSSLMNVIHPPIDKGLWDGIKEKYRAEKSVIAKTHVVQTIKGIDSYDIYETIISGIEQITKREKWRLIEVETLWTGTKYKI